MEKEILLVKNSTRESPGLLEVELNDRGIEYTLVDLEQGQTFPPVKNYGAVVVLGGPDSANDENEKMKNELTRIRETIATNIPYLGICLGLQTLVNAVGGSVEKSPTREVGFIDPDGNNFTVELTDDGKQDPLFKGLNHTFNIFHLHGETVRLTNDMTLLAIGKYCQNQIVKVGTNTYGIQCHFELTTEMFETWITQDPDLLQLDTGHLRANFATIRDQYTRVGRQLCKNFLQIAGY
ncbi:MAG: glutamine amidotransferase [Candidatus Magasanikbacteria bacterium CG11_big_fil_rev_8_21_14_0_20_43_7]|uniref:Glutamine amidotransferase n=1 Tax=Candidatus Magasanikbacteria bacterium CG11_big_fil_rev_8_21_14_0_20_43_7 TaxID=1974654 RepID=A0A2H0N339_9BACT|nr:MAG: glutamine amidotransferase [Candidatus Magasanikbacteria bacterium CG11_big_fil_rev_8_21_14_0_20_43_7]